MVDEDSTSSFEKELFEKFKETWSIFDIEADGQIEASKMNDVLLQLKEPLGWNSSFAGNLDMQMEYIEDSELMKQLKNDKISFLDMLEHLTLLYIIRLQI